SLVDERKRLANTGESKIYDVTAWNHAHALDLEAYWCQPERTRIEPLSWPPPEVTHAGVARMDAGSTRRPARKDGASSSATARKDADSSRTTARKDADSSRTTAREDADSTSAVAYIVDGRNDGSVRFATMAMQSDIKVRLA